MQQTVQVTEKGGDAKQSRSFRPARVSAWMQDSWVLEYVALTVSIACLIAIIVTLLCFQNKPLDEWHSDLSINTVLSILATALKGAALLATSSGLGQLKWSWYSSTPRSLERFHTFDSASRGPFGALMLLGRSPSSILACLGSFIMIIALGSDAAVQASTSQPLRLKFSKTASVPVAHVYDAYYPTGRVDPLLANAIYTGIFSADNSSTRAEADYNISYAGTPNNLTPFCDTGNCTFDPYVSLAVKNECVNMTDSLQYTENSNGSLQFANLLVSFTGPEALQGPAFNLSGHLSKQLSGTLVNMSCPEFSTLAETLEITQPLEQLPFAEVYMMILNYKLKKFEAFRCNLDFGLKLYTASVEQGQFVETPGDFIQGTWTFQPNNTTNNGNVLDDSSVWSLSTNVSGTEHQVSIKLESWGTILEWIPDYFSGNDESTANTPDNLVRVAFNISHWGMDVSLLFDAIAESITQYFRTASGQVATGTAQSQEQYIQVVWPWMIVPIVLVVLNCIFLLAVHSQSRRLEIPSWRNSALALMLSEKAAEEGEVDVDVDRDCVLIGPPQSITGMSELDQWAKTRPAILRGKDKGNSAITKTDQRSSTCEMDEFPLMAVAKRALK